jgi:hypothetical protein
MQSTRSAPEWGKFIDVFNSQFRGRETRLGVFESNRRQTTDYWIESGLPLVSLDLDDRGKMPAVEMRVGKLSHRIPNAVRLSFIFSPIGSECGLDVTDSDGRTTVLRFEPK